MSRRGRAPWALMLAALFTEVARREPRPRNRLGVCLVLTPPPHLEEGKAWPQLFPRHS